MTDSSTMAPPRGGAVRLIDAFAYTAGVPPLAAQLGAAALVVATLWTSPAWASETPAPLGNSAPAVATPDAPAAAAGWRIPQGRDRQLRAWVLPALQGAGLVDEAGQAAAGVLRWAAQIALDRVVLTVAFGPPGAEPGEGRLEIPPPTGPPGAAPPPAFTATCDGVCPQRRLDALSQALAATWGDAHPTLWEPPPVSPEPTGGTTDEALPSAEEMAQDPNRPPPVPTPWPYELALLLALLLLVVRSVHGLSAGERLALAAVFVAGVAVRAVFAVEAPMTAWPYARVLPFADVLARSPTVAALAPDGAAWSLSSLIGWTSFGLAAAAPLTLFAHARHLLKDVPSALMAAALMALLPQAVRFARADTHFIQSLTLSSAAFAALYGALSDRDPVWRGVQALMLPGLVAATLVTRPLNLAFLPVFLGAVFATVPADVPRRRRVAATLLLLATAAWSVVTYLLPGYRANVGEGLSLETLGRALQVVIDLDRNTLFNAAVTPTLVMIATCAGAKMLWGRDRRSALLLVGWYGLFFVAHGAVVPWGWPMQTRYHLHLITPMVMLAAACTPWLLRQPFWKVQVPLVALLVASPLLHSGMIRDTDFSVMNEWRFVRAEAAALPDGCLALEHDLAYDNSRPRWTRHGLVVSPPTVRQRLAPEDLPDALESTDPAARDDALAELRARLDAASCAVFLEGLTCTFDAPDVASRAAACDSVLSLDGWRRVAEDRWTHRTYDTANWGLGGGLVNFNTDSIPLVVRVWRWSPGAAP